MLLVIQEERCLCSSETERQIEEEKVDKLLHLTACLILPSLLFLGLATMLSFPFYLCSAGHEGGEGKKNPGKKAEQMQHADGKLPRMGNVGLGSCWKLTILREPLQTLQQDPYPLTQESRMHLVWEARMCPGSNCPPPRGL